MLIRFSATEKTVVPEATIWDYPISKDIGISYQQLKGRGPQTGQYLNTVCHEIYFIIKGTATFDVKGEKQTVKEKDVVVVEPNTPHSIETTNLEYITITRPDWYEEQYQLIP